MKILRTTLLLFISVMYACTVSAQDVKIYINNGSRLQVPYEQLDSIVSISYTEKDFVDLGLSVKWASCNVGAGTPGEGGTYFAWGEVSPKDSYDASNSVTYDREMRSICGDLIYDAATVRWGVTMRLPSKAECEELMYDCQWTAATHDGVSGMLVTGPSGNSIFLPAAGYRHGTLTEYGDEGFYWSGDPTPDKNGHAVAIHFGGDEPIILNAYRYTGMYVRAVADREISKEEPR